MLHEYALDPQVISRWQAFRYFIDQFGVHQGRMIARFPKSWKRLVYEATSRCSEIERKRIEEGLTQINSKILPSSRAYAGLVTWLENAETQHALKPFHAIITCDSPNCATPILIADEVCETTELWNVPSQIRVPRAAPEMAQRVHSFLAASQEILFVDPHFNPRAQRFRRSLEHFLQRSVNLSRQLKRVEYHLKYDDGKPSTNDFIDQCRSKLPALLPEGVELKLIRWMERPGGRKPKAG